MKKTTKDYFFVGVQLLLFGLFVLPFKNVNLIAFNLQEFFGGLLSGLGFGIVVVSLLQLWTSLSPFPTPKENNILKTDYFYKFVRHPIYTGILLIFAGFCVLTGEWPKMVITILLSILFYFKSEYEEERLARRYPNTYPDYKQKTGRFLPKLF